MDSSSNPRPMSIAELLGQGQTSGSTAPKRRQTMQEMLRESQRLQTTVALPDAVEQAQAAAARKIEAEEAARRPQSDSLPAPADSADSAAAVAPAESARAPIPWARSSSVDVTASDPEIPVRINDRPAANLYILYAKMQGRWVWQCDLSASTHADAMKQVIAWLRPEHDALPIRLEQDQVAVAV